MFIVLLLNIEERINLLKLHIMNTSRAIYIYIYVYMYVCVYVCVSVSLCVCRIHITIVEAYIVLAFRVTLNGKKDANLVTKIMQQMTV